MTKENIKSIPLNGRRKTRVKIGDPDFQPPDGDWGWLIVFACGFSNLSTFPMFQQFGLLFREKFENLGITNAQTTTVINMNSAFTACVGLLNGPLFRKFSYRQVALSGASLVVVSLFLSRFCNSFWTYLILYSACYGSGIGITQSANALALNTYFKEKRRIATGLSWTTTGLGPVVWPYIVIALMGEYGMEGALLIFSGFAAHAIMCSLLLQPVHWHTKFREITERKDAIATIEDQKSETQTNLINTAYEIVDPGTPMMIKSNDGWYSQNRSLVGSKICSGQNSVAISTKPSFVNLQEPRSKNNSFVNLNQEFKERKRKIPSQPKYPIAESINEDCPSQKPPQDLKEDENIIFLSSNNIKVQHLNEDDVLKTAAIKLQEYQMKEIQFEHENHLREKMQENQPQPQFSLWEKIMIFFDFNLLKDPVYLSLMLGITIANFAELNFSILTPFVLKEFQFEKYQIATFMSLLGAMDIFARFFISFFADKIGWDNKTFFLAGVLSMALGRIILVHTKTFSFSLLVAVIIGLGKGLRTIFIALVIPSYVPIERLPAASGLQLATSGFLFFTLGPVVGWIRDLVNNYVITLHILNIMTYITAAAWLLGDLNCNKKPKMEQKSKS